MRVFTVIVATLSCLAATGCHSALISATISNHRAAPVSLVELDYPSASFGIQKLAPGEDYHYRFKVIGSGSTTLLWTDGANDEHKNPGPALRDGDEGTLTVTLTDEQKATWDLRLKNRAIAP
jgi:hypothetical protein